MAKIPKMLAIYCISQIRYQLHVLFGHCAKNKYGILWDGHGQQIEHLANTLSFLSHEIGQEVISGFSFARKIKTKSIQYATDNSLSMTEFVICLPYC